MRVVAIIPAYNEAASIAGVVRETLPFVEAVAVVDDGSRDGTADIAREAGAHVIEQPRNKGKGRALQAGADYCLAGGFDALVALDADGQHDPRSIPDLRRPVEEARADMAVGSRKAEWARHMPLVRRITNSVMSRLLSLVAGQVMEDTQSGYRLIHARVLRVVTMESSHFEAESEFLLKAARHGFRIGWVPIRAIYGGRPSHIRPFRDLIRFVRMMWRVLVGTPRA